MNLYFNFRRTAFSGISVLRPEIPISLFQKDGTAVPFTGVLDTGSDFFLLPLEIAELLELEFDKTKTTKASGYEGMQFETSYAKVRFRIEKGKEKIEESCWCAVRTDQEPKPDLLILGSSFLRNFRLEFDYPNNRFHIREKIAHNK